MFRLREINIDVFNCHMWLEWIANTILQLLISVTYHNSRVYLNTVSIYLNGKEPTVRNCAEMRCRRKWNTRAVSMLSIVKIRLMCRQFAKHYDGFSIAAPRPCGCPFHSPRPSADLGFRHSRLAVAPTSSLWQIASDANEYRIRWLCRANLAEEFRDKRTVHAKIQT